jgi:hypothetical protein
VCILLDESLPRPLARLLPEHDGRTVAAMGWAGKRNGEHLRATSARSRKRLTLVVPRPERARRAPVRCTAGLGRAAANCILPVMTRALDVAIAKLATLPADEQDRIAEWLLDELRDDEHWERQFANSQDALSKLAAEARADRTAGRATELDPDKL